MKKTILNSVETVVMAVLTTVLTIIMFAAATSCAKANTKAKDWTAKTSFASLETQMPHCDASQIIVDKDSIVDVEFKSEYMETSIDEGCVLYTNRQQGIVNLKLHCINMLAEDIAAGLDDRENFKPTKKLVILKLSEDYYELTTMK